MLVLRRALFAFHLDLFKSKSSGKELESQVFFTFEFSNLEHKMIQCRYEASTISKIVILFFRELAAYDS